jgi:hypothetical protein
MSRAKRESTHIFLLLLSDSELLCGSSVCYSCEHAVERLAPVTSCGVHMVPEHVANHRLLEITLCNQRLLILYVKQHLFFLLIHYDPRTVVLEPPHEYYALLSPLTCLLYHLRRLGSSLILAWLLLLKLLGMACDARADLLHAIVEVL